jgi:hypothetical protein
VGNRGSRQSRLRRQNLVNSTGRAATAAKHAYSKKGTYKITITIADNTGVTTTVTKKVRVS